MARVVLENVYKSFAADRQWRSQKDDRDAIGQVTSPEQIERRNHQSPVLRNVNLTIADGEFMVLVGASGCGKSTLLRLIAGLDTVTAGAIWVDDRRVNDLPPKDRDIAMVFQNYALYPHMHVYDNLAFGLRRTSSDTSAPSSTFIPRWAENLLAASTRHLPKALRYWSARERWIDHRVKTVATMLQIEGLLQRFPKQLSGGQKQRVALGRAIARNPAVFLMDEPLSNLDAKLRAETRAQIVALQRQLGITTIYVTHDQVEAMTMGDRIAVIHAGQIQQIAPPLELYNHPANQYVAGFIGSPPMNFLTVQVTAPTTIVHGSLSLRLAESWANTLTDYVGQLITLGIRPEHLHLTDPSDDPSAQAIAAVVQHVEALGNETYITAALETPHSPDATYNIAPVAPVPVAPTTVQVRLHPETLIRQGDPIHLAITSDRIHLFDPHTGNALNLKR